VTPSTNCEKLTHPPLQAFTRRFGKAHLNLACHAAFPLALTPELLYCLRENFQPQAPWIAVADILLSLCDPVIGYELYELEPEVRHELIVTASGIKGTKLRRELSRTLLPLHNIFAKLGCPRLGNSKRDACTTYFYMVPN